MNGVTEFPSLLKDPASSLPSPSVIFCPSPSATDTHPEKPLNPEDDPWHKQQLVNDINSSSQAAEDVKSEPGSEFGEDLEHGQITALEPTATNKETRADLEARLAVVTKGKAEAEQRLQEWDARVEIALAGLKAVQAEKNALIAERDSLKREMDEILKGGERCESVKRDMCRCDIHAGRVAVELEDIYRWFRSKRS